MRIRLLAVFVAALLSQLAAAPVQAAAPPQLLAMTFNVCGNVCRHGEVSTTAANVAYQAWVHGASVVMLQELCYSQFVGVRARLARYGYSGIFAAQTKGGHCDDHDRTHGKGFGLGLFARGKLTGAVARRLPMPSPVHPEPRMVLGATVRLGGRSVFVVTSHTSPSGPNLIAQMKAVTSWLTPIAARRAVLFGGDLNSMPDNPDLDGLYTSFTEADGDRTNPRPTFRTVPRKIDYLFGSDGHLSRVGAATSCGRYSDHCAYFGRFR